MWSLFYLVVHAFRIGGAISLSLVVAVGYRYFPKEAQFESAKGVSGVRSELERLVKIDSDGYQPPQESAWYTIMLMLQQEQWKSALLALEPYVNKMEEPSLYWAHYALNYGSIRKNARGRIIHSAISQYEMLEMSAANGNPYAQYQMSYLCNDYNESYLYENQDELMTCEKKWRTLAKESLAQRKASEDLDLRSEYLIRDLNGNISTKSEYHENFEFAVNAAKDHYYEPILDRLYDLTSPNGPFWDQRTSFDYSYEEKILLKKVLNWLLDRHVAISSYLLSKFKKVFTSDEYLNYLRRWLLMVPESFEHELDRFYIDADLSLAIEGLAYAKVLNSYSYDTYDTESGNAKHTNLVARYISFAGIFHYSASAGRYVKVEFRDEDIRKADILAENLKSQVSPTIYLRF